MLTPLQFTPALCGKKLLQLPIRNLTRNHTVRQRRLSRVTLAQRLSSNRRLATLSTTAFQTPNPGHALTPIDLRRREPFPNMLWLTSPPAGELPPTKQSFISGRLAMTSNTWDVIHGHGPPFIIAPREIFVI
jgi:hypothetical protein